MVKKMKSDLNRDDNPALYFTSNWDQQLQFEGLVPQGPICISAILRKSALKFFAMFQIDCRVLLDKKQCCKQA